jgi:hypothetical protein
MASPAPEVETRASRRFFRTLPWLVTLGAVLYIALTTEPARLWSSLESANHVAFLAIVFPLYGALFVCDSYALSWLFTRFHRPVAFTEALPARGAAYLLGIVNYHAGSVAMSLYFKRVRGVSVLRSLGSLLFMSAIDLLLITVFVAVGGFFVAGPADLVGLQLAAAGVLVAFAAGLAYWRLGIDFLVLGTLRRRAIFATFAEARLADYLALAWRRLPVVLLYVAFHGLTLLTFDIHVPLRALLVYVPVQMFIAALPVSVAGIGTVQLAQRALYAPWASQAVVDAYGAALVLGFVLPRLVIGLVYVGRAGRRLAEGDAGTAAQDETAPEPAGERRGCSRSEG